MNSKLIFGSILAIAALMSCNTEESVDVLDSNPKAQTPKAQFTAHIPTTPASGSSWLAGDSIGVYMKKNGQELSAASIAEKVENYQQVTVKGDGVFVGATPAEDVYFPVDGSAVDFVAYYPYQKTISGFSYPIDVSSQSDLPAIDLLYSDNVVNLTKAAPQVAFTFTHRLANLVVTLTAGDGLTTADLTNAKVSLTGQKTLGSMALATGIVTPSTLQTTKQIIDFKMTGTSASAIVLPAAATEGRKLIITISTGEVFEWGIPSTTAFDSGSRYIYHITLNRTKIYVTSTITDWTAGNGSGDNGNASMTDL